MNPRIDQSIVLIVLVPQTLLMPATKEVAANAMLGDAWVNRTPRQVSHEEVDGSTPGNIRCAVRIIEPPSPVLIRIFSTSPPCGFNKIQKVVNKRKSTSPALVRHIPKLDAVIDGKLPSDLDSAPIFSKEIGQKLSNGFMGDLYLCCRMNFVANTVQTQTPQVMDLGLLKANKLDERSGLSTSDTRIRRPTDVSHWIVLDHGFGEATAVVMSGAKSDHDYNYKAEFQIWKYSKEFEQQNIFMSRPPLDSTLIVTNTTNTKIKFWPDSCWYKNNRLQATNATNRISKTQKKREKSMLQRTQSQTHHLQTHHQANLIHLMTENTSNLKARDAIKIKSIRNSQKKDPPESSSSDSDSSNESYYERKRLNYYKRYRKNDPIRLCTKLMAKLLTQNINWRH